MATNHESSELREIRKKLRMSQEEFAASLGIDRSRYKNWEYGQSQPPAEILNRARLLTSVPIDSQADVRPVSLLFGEMTSMPVVGSVSAGPGATNVDPDQDEVWVPMSLRQIGGVGYVIDGDSMMPALQPGDIALFKEMYQPRNGFTFLLKRDGEYRCKNIAWQSSGWVMQSLNPNKEQYPDQPLADWQILGILVGWYRSLGSYEKLEADPHGLRLDGPV